MDAATSRKLNLHLDKAPGHPWLKDVVPSLFVLSIVHIDGLKSTTTMEYVTRSLLTWSTANVTMLQLKAEHP